MAYFGRKPKKPGSKPGAQSGGTRQDRAVRSALRLVGGLLDRGRQERPGRPGRVNRSARASRAGRSAR